MPIGDLAVHLSSYVLLLGGGWRGRLVVGCVGLEFGRVIRLLTYFDSFGSANLTAIVVVILYVGVCIVRTCALVHTYICVYC